MVQIEHVNSAENSLLGLFKVQKPFCGVGVRDGTDRTY